MAPEELKDLESRILDALDELIDEVNGDISHEEWVEVCANVVCSMLCDEEKEDIGLITQKYALLMKQIALWFRFEMKVKGEDL